jgi:hypothetical protein
MSKYTLLVTFDCNGATSTSAREEAVQWALRNLFLSDGEEEMVRKEADEEIAREDKSVSLLNGGKIHGGITQTRLNGSGPPTSAECQSYSGERG